MSFLAPLIPELPAIGEGVAAGAEGAVGDVEGVFGDVEGVFGNAPKEAEGAASKLDKAKSLGKKAASGAGSLAGNSTFDKLAGLSIIGLITGAGGLRGLLMILGGGILVYLALRQLT